MKNIRASIELHDTLNPKLWNTDNTLREDVKEKLNKIVEEFAESIDIPLTIVDAHIVGSNASYNYTENSDLDLHCIVNFSRLDADPSIIEALMWSEKKRFNDEYNITIRGIDVEIYVEDIGSNTYSNGIYSLFEDKWIKEPTPIEIEIDDEKVDAEVQKWIPIVDKALVNKDLEDIEDLVDQLYLVRKNGLVVDGEYGVGNQTFKELRNLGYIDKLKGAIVDLKSEELSITGSFSPFKKHKAPKVYYNPVAASDWDPITTEYPTDIDDAIDIALDWSCETGADSCILEMVNGSPHGVVWSLA